MKSFKRVMSVLLCIVMIISTGFCNQKVNAKSGVMFTSDYGEIYKSGNYYYCRLAEDLCQVNIKTGKVKKIIKVGYGNTVTHIVKYKNYIVYRIGYDFNTYVVKLNGTGKKKILDSETGCLCHADFIKSGRLYYYKNGLYSMKIDGTDKKCLYKGESGAGMVYYTNNHYYVYSILANNWAGEYGVLDSNYKNYKKITKKQFNVATSKLYPEYASSYNNTFESKYKYKNKKYYVDFDRDNGCFTVYCGKKAIYTSEEDKYLDSCELESISCNSIIVSCIDSKGNKQRAKSVMITTKGKEITTRNGKWQKAFY